MSRARTTNRIVGIAVAVAGAALNALPASGQEEEDHLLGFKIKDLNKVPPPAGQYELGSVAKVGLGRFSRGNLGGPRTCTENGAWGRVGRVVPSRSSRPLPSLFGPRRAPNRTRVRNRG